MLTSDQHEVVQRVKATMRLDKEEGRIHVKYPLKPEAYLETDNDRQAKAMQANIERRTDGRLPDRDAEGSKSRVSGEGV